MDSNGNNSQSNETDGYLSMLIAYSPNPLIKYSASMIKTNSLILKQIQETFIEVNREFDRLSEKKKSHNQSSYELSSPSMILNYIKSSREVKFRLSLQSDLPRVLYKGRYFSFTLTIQSIHGGSEKLEKPEKFGLSVFTADNPPKEVSENKNSGRILDKNFESFGSSEIIFKKVSVNDVSSHYRNGILYLVVRGLEDSAVEPLVLDEIVFKARKEKMHMQG